ncbi:hypothetical protein [Limnobacter sp.]|uniref:hypothetical protein n=1 Tax=Limnobacter sp. TaxID=2003368 RepID=UPI00311EB7A4
MLLPSNNSVHINPQGPTEITGQFEYNYFTEDERTDELNTFFENESERYKALIGEPRRILIDITMPTVDLPSSIDDVRIIKTINFCRDNFQTYSDGQNVENADAVFSDSINSGFFTLNLFPQDLEQNVVTQFSDSGELTKNRLERFLAGNYGDNLPKSLEESIRNSESFVPVINQSSGTKIKSSFSPMQDKSPISQLSMDFGSSIVKASSNPLNPYLDELLSITQETEKLQNNSRNSNLTSAYESLFTDEFGSIYIPKAKQYNEVGSASQYKYEGLWFIGYFVVKQDLTTEPIRNINYSFYPSQELTLQIADPYVAYGRNYRYSVHAVYARVTYSSNGYSASTIISQDCERIEVKTREFIPPLPPVNLVIRKEERTTRLSWQRNIRQRQVGQKFVKSDDTAATMVYLRNSVHDPYELVSYVKNPKIINYTMPTEIIPENIIRYSEKSDVQIGLSDNRNYYVALAEVDVHGNISNLSEQILVYRDKLRNTFIYELASKAGAPRAYPNMYYEDVLIKDIIDTDDIKEMTIFYSPDLPQYEKSSDSVPSYRMQLIDINSQSSKILDIKVKLKT